MTTTSNSAPDAGSKPPTERICGIDLPRPLARGLAVLLALVVYATVASIAKPGRSSAQPGVTPATQLPKLPAAKPDQGSVKAPVRNSRGGRLLGQLTGGERLVWIYASPDGPRYTVATREGKILQENLEADDVYRAFPELDIESMRLEPRPADRSPRTPLMTADSDRGA